MKRRLGNYWIIDSLGQGGFADVYLGEHVFLRKLAAIKVLNDRPTREKLERFRTEAKITDKLTHRHIVQVLDFDENSSPPFLVMEYAPNGSLDTRHRGERLPLPTIVSYVKQISGALDYTHRRGVIHCDVKPNNMLLDANDNILLIDFGIAVITNGYAQVPRIFGGTETYMAPEQYWGRPLPVSDQYSLGIAVYEWLSGSPPFSGSSTDEIAEQHRYVSPPSLNVRAPGTPPAVQRVVLRALEKDPDERFSSVGAFALALERASQEDADKLTPVPSLRYQPANRSPHAAVQRHSIDPRQQRAIARQRRLRGVPQQRIFASQRDMPPPPRRVSRPQW
jgi:serine/threonine protein kinase